MDIRVTYWKDSDGQCSQKHDKGIKPITKILSRCNKHYICGLASAAYGAWGYQDGDSIIEIEIETTKTSKHRTWRRLQGKEIYDTYLSQFMLTPSQSLEGNEISVCFDDCEGCNVAYFRNTGDKFIEGLKWFIENVCPDVEFERPKTTKYRYVL
jgi:hypothetical protein